MKNSFRHFRGTMCLFKWPYVLRKNAISIRTYSPQSCLLITCSFPALFYKRVRDVLSAQLRFYQPETCTRIDS